MLKSAEYFMAGFFGLEWTNNATIEVIIEASGFNNSLAGSKGCPNSGKEAGINATIEWVGKYLQKGEAETMILQIGSYQISTLMTAIYLANARLSSMVQGYDWDIVDTYAAQSMCPYETVSHLGITLSQLAKKQLLCVFWKLRDADKRRVQAAYGFSRFCSLFTYEEWIGFSYSVGMLPIQCRVADVPHFMVGSKVFG